jgi:aspartyl-tRNA(Asn)/glutamyl-tRNA(Gln) amidotransferase subunit A
LCSVALGTDTGGSIRQPAAFCGVVGLKPTYGRVSRWGAIAFASSLDQIGPLTRTVEDAALLLEVIAGLDPRDETSIDAPVPRYRDALTGDVAGMRVGIPFEYYEGAVDADVRGALERTKAILVERGAQLVDISLPHTKHALPAYYIVAPAEASSNLARYDGIRFGAAAKGAKDLLDLYQKARGEGFGVEVKRRIMLGTFALRSGYYDAYYKKAQQVRTLIKRDFDKAFQHVDVVLTPTTPTCAFRFGAKASPLEMYQADVFTLACNLAGLPGISVPCGLSGEGLPIGAQLLGKPLDESTLLRAAHVIESSLGIAQRPKAVS